MSNSSDVAQLIPLLPYISLEAIKSVILQEIKELNVETTRNAYFNVLPIDEIIPDDVSQHILTFSGSHHTKGINKK